MQSQSTQTVQSSGIHCKASFQGEVRRFSAHSTQYAQLLEQICQLFGCQKDSVVIKYADNEGDNVTVSSDAEVQFAVSEGTTGKVLRLHVEAKSAPQTENLELPCAMETEENGSWRKHPRCAEKIEDRLTRMKQKREKLQAKLAQLEAEGQNENSAKHLNKIRHKLGFITARIEWLSSPDAQNSPAPFGRCGKKGDRCGKKGKRCGKYASSEQPEMFHHGPYHGHHRGAHRGVHEPRHRWNHEGPHGPHHAPHGPHHWNHSGPHQWNHQGPHGPHHWNHQGPHQWNHQGDPNQAPHMQCPMQAAPFPGQWQPAPEDQKKSM